MVEEATESFDIIMDNASQLFVDFSYQPDESPCIGPIRFVAGQSARLSIVVKRGGSDIEFFAKVGANEEESVAYAYDGEAERDGVPPLSWTV